MLTGVISGMKEDETFSPYGLPGYQVTLFRSNVAEYIADIALMLDDNVHIDRALDYIVYLEPVWRPRRIRQMIRRPYSRKMIEYAVNGMGGRVNDMRHECCETVVRLFNEGQLIDGTQCEPLATASPLSRYCPCWMTMMPRHLSGALSRTRVQSAGWQALKSSAGGWRMAAGKGSYRSSCRMSAP